MNINSIRNKFDPLITTAGGNIEILLITETKIDSTFPINQFHLNGYNMPDVPYPFWFYVRDDIRSHM